jgi:hypothetical protein
LLPIISAAKYIPITSSDDKNTHLFNITHLLFFLE